MTAIAIILLLCVGIYDIYLFSQNKKTISKHIEGYLPNGVDVAIVITVLVLVWAFWGPTEFLKILLGVLLGHTLLGHETYRKD